MVLTCMIICNIKIRLTDSWNHTFSLIPSELRSCHGCVANDCKKQSIEICFVWLGNPKCRVRESSGLTMSVHKFVTLLFRLTKILLSHFHWHGCSNDMQYFNLTSDISKYGVFRKIGVTSEILDMLYLLKLGHN